MADDGTLQIKMFMRCKSCGNQHLGVGVSTENELVMVCHECEKIVAVFNNWPDESVTECECESCKDHKVPPKEELN